MKKKLTLSVEEKAVNHAREYFGSGKSLSEIVENIFLSLPGEHDKIELHSPRLSRFIQTLPDVEAEQPEELKESYLREKYLRD